jgi:catechol 2,3-dioxygenase-like lactoylglutathione lyase family enzyme
MRLISWVFLIFFVSPSYGQLAIPSDAGITFGHVHLKVTDPELHTKLWVDHFGGVVSQQSGLADRGLTAIRFPNFFIILEEGVSSGGTAGSVMDHIGFKVRNIEDFLADWRAAGYTVDREFIGSEGVPNGYVTMPDGIWVELQEDQGLHVEVSGYHIHYRTPMFVELLDWYVDVFNLDIRPRGRIETTTNVPGMNMSFALPSGEWANSDTAATRGRSLDHIGFEIDNLEAFYQNLVEKGVEFDVEFREIEGIAVKVAAFTDPSGVRVELTEGLDQY